MELGILQRVEKMGNVRGYKEMESEGKRDKEVRKEGDN